MSNIVELAVFCILSSMLCCVDKETSSFSRKVLDFVAYVPYAEILLSGSNLKIVCCCRHATRNSEG